MKKGKISVIVIIILLLILGTFVFAGKEQQKSRVKEFLSVDKEKASVGDIVTLTLDLSQVTYDEFVLTIQGDKQILNSGEVNANSEKETSVVEKGEITLEKENDVTMKLYANKQSLDTEEIKLCFVVPETLKVGDKINLYATLEEVKNSGFEKAEENSIKNDNGANEGTKVSVEVEKNEQRLQENTTDADKKADEIAESNQKNNGKESNDEAESKQEKTADVKVDIISDNKAGNEQEKGDTGGNSDSKVDNKQETNTNADANKNSDSKVDNNQETNTNVNMNKNLDSKAESKQETATKSDIDKNSENKQTNSENAIKEVTITITIVEKTNSAKTMDANAINLENVFKEQTNSKKETSSSVASTSTSKSKTTSSSSTAETYKGSSNKYLSNIEIEGYELTPKFNITNTTYFLEVESSVNALNIATEKYDSSEIVTIYGNEELETGTNKILINVTAEDGSTKIYRIYVKKK